MSSPMREEGHYWFREGLGEPWEIVHVREGRVYQHGREHAYTVEAYSPENFGPQIEKSRVLELEEKVSELERMIEDIKEVNGLWDGR